VNRRTLELLGLALVPVAAFGVFFVLPVSGMLAEGLFPDGTFDPGGVSEVLARPRTHRVLWFTVWSSAVGTALSLLLGLPAAYVLHRLRLPARRVLLALLLVPFVLPTVVVGMAFTGWAGSVLAIVVAHVFFNVAVVVRVVGTAWSSIGQDVEDAAEELGASGWRRFTRVLLPLARPAIVSAATIVFLFTFTSFGVILILGGPRNSTLETEIYRQTAQLLNLPLAAAGGVLGVLVAALLRGVPAVLSLGSLVGFVTVLGITTRNAIMMVSHYRHLVEEEGRAWDAETARRGATDRVVPILMTALVTALGLLPVALAADRPGGELDGPMAVVILGGLVSSTALNLLLLPALCLRFGRFEPAASERSAASADAPAAGA
jgi:ABC-type Fe3+ transport system permease subunit